MVALKAGDVEALIRRGPDPRIVLILVYGPDTGLVADRAGALTRLFVGGSDDPFALVRIDGDTLAADPGRLVDEAGTLGLFGGSRTLRVRAGSRPFVAAVEALLASESVAARVVVEAGDLAKSAPLRALCEKSQRALAMPCYPDDERALAALIDQTLAQEGLRIDREARDLLAASLGGDRRASLMEIDKLALYARGEGSIGIAAVEAVASDVSSGVLTSLIDAAFAGRMAEVERDLRRFRQEGLDPSALLGAALRQALSLLDHRLTHAGASPSAMVASWRGLHFRRRASIETQLGRWTPEALLPTIAMIQEAVLACRRSGPELAQAQASAALLRISGAGQRHR